MTVPVLIGEQLHLNTLTTGYQGQVRIEALKDGGFVAVWEDHSEISKSIKVIRGQIFNSDGTKKGAEMVISASDAGMRAGPSVAVLNDGRFVITWGDPNIATDGSGFGVLAKIYSADGTLTGEALLVNTTTFHDQFQPSLTALANGGFAIAFSSLASDGSQNDIRSQAYDADLNRIEGEVLANTTIAGDQLDAQIMRCGDGYAVFYNDYSSSPDDPVAFTLRGRILAADGQEVKAEFLVPTAGPGLKGSASAESLANGNFVVTWTTDGSGTVDTRGQVFRADGSKLGAEFIVGGGADNQLYSVVTALPSGRFAIAYDHIVEPSGTDPGRTEIRLAIFNADGTRHLATDFVVASFATAWHEKPDIKLLADGQLLVAWENPLTVPEDAEGGIHAQIVDIGESGAGPTDIALSNVIAQEMSAAATVVGELSATDALGSTFSYAIQRADGTWGSTDGRFEIEGGQLKVANGLLLDYEQAQSHTIKIKVTDQDGLSYEEAFTINVSDVVGERIAGTAGRDIVFGGAGTDVLNGGPGDDRLVGGADDDIYYVDNKDDVVVEGATGGMADLVYTSTNYTLPDYVEQLFAIGSSAISLAGNNLSNILTGNAAGNILKGSEGHDTLNGGVGNDQLWGGAGADRFMFASALSAKFNRDLIKDWSSKEDAILLENAVFKKLTKTGVLKKAYFVKAAQALDSNDFVGYNAKTGNLWYDPNGNKAGGQIVFGNLGTNKLVLSSDFVII